MPRARFIALNMVALCGLFVCAQPAHADWYKLTQEGSEAFQQSNFGQSERLFRQALQEAETFGDHDLRLATSLTNLGVVLKAHAQIAKAEPLFEKAVLVQRNVLGNSDFEVITSTAKLCQFYISRSEWSKADPLCEQILTFAQTHRCTAEHELELAVLLDGLSRSYSDRAQSEELCKQALSIRERALPRGHMAIASSCENLAKLYSDQGRQNDAEQYFKRALEISEQTLGKGKPETLTRLDSLALCRSNLGQNKEAEQLYRSGLDIAIRAYGKRSGYTAKMQIGLANVLSKQSRFSEAAPLLAEALQTQEAIQGSENAVLTPLLDAYADALDRTNRHSEASKLHNRAKAIRGWM
jgi:tetratricopeptide (TPR) repeat protein